MYDLNKLQGYSIVIHNFIYLFYFLFIYFFTVLKDC